MVLRKIKSGRKGKLYIRSEKETIVFPRWIPYEMLQKANISALRSVLHSLSLYLIMKTIRGHDFSYYIMSLMIAPCCARTAKLIITLAYNICSVRCRVFNFDLKCVTQDGVVPIKFKNKGERWIVYCKRIFLHKRWAPFVYNNIELIFEDIAINSNLKHFSHITLTHLKEIGK